MSKLNYMRNSMFALLLIFLGFNVQAGVIENVSGALNKGDVNSIMSMIDENVEISILDEEDTYSAAQASVILKDFFNSYPVKSFKIKHKGDSKDGKMFGIGNLYTSNGNFRVTIYIKSGQNGEKIHLISFEED